MMSQRFFRGFRIKDEGFRVCRLWAKGMRHKVSDYSYDEVQRWNLKDVIGSCPDRLLRTRALQITIYSKLSLDLLPLWSRYWEFWTNHLKSRLQLNYVPVHETHSATVGKIPMISKALSLNRIVDRGNGSLGRLLKG